MLEDVEKLRWAKKAGKGVTVAGLLNAIDGAVASDGRILAMTANDTSALDPIMMRPGRIDRRWEIPRPGFDEARAIFLRFFPGEQWLARSRRRRGYGLAAAHRQRGAPAGRRCGCLGDRPRVAAGLDGHELRAERHADLGARAGDPAESGDAERWVISVRTATSCAARSHSSTATRRAQPGGPLEAAVVEPGKGRRAALLSRRGVEVYAAALRDQRPLDPQYERARRDRAAADLGELKVHAERGVLLPADEVERQWVAEVTALRNHLLSVPTIACDRIYRAAVLGDVAAVERELDDQMRRVLTELSSPARPIVCPHCGADMTQPPAPSSTCGAPTKAGNPCTRPAGAGGRCFQHHHQPHEE